MWKTLFINKTNNVIFIIITELCFFFFLFFTTFLYFLSTNRSWCTLCQWDLRLFGVLDNLLLKFDFIALSNAIIYGKVLRILYSIVWRVPRRASSSVQFKSILKLYRNGLYHVLHRRLSIFHPIHSEFFLS